MNGRLKVEQLEQRKKGILCKAMNVDAAEVLVRNVLLCSLKHVKWKENIEIEVRC